MGAAIGLAASFFPVDVATGHRRTTTRADALFVLDGHIADWSGWSTLSDGDARRFTKLLRRRPNQLANAEAAGKVLDRLLVDGEIPGCRAADDYTGDDNGRILVEPGMPLPTFLDGFLRDLDVLDTGRERSLPSAEAGPHTTTTVISGPDGISQKYVDFRYEIRPHHVARTTPAPTLMDAPVLLDRWVPFSQLWDIAARIDHGVDSTGDTDFRRKAVDQFAERIQSREGTPVTGLRLTAGILNELLAYTGFGKSVVLVETFACWAATQDIVMAFVLPTNADVVRVTHAVERALHLLGEDTDRTVVPLVSPRALIKVAETSSARTPAQGPDADWIWRRFGYGCALAAVADSGGAADGWQPGREPCAKLRSPRPRGRDKRVACPWRTTCDRSRPVREACAADIIVTTHANLLTGLLQTPVDDGGGESDRLTVEELVLRRCQIVVIDEIDLFQQFAIDRAGRGLVLDRAGRTNTPLRNFDRDFGEAFGRLHDETDASVRDAFVNLRYLSETYVSHLTYARLGATSRLGRRRPRGPGRFWMVPRRWDNWLAGKLFGVEPDDVSADQMNTFRSLFPDGPDLAPDAPKGFAEARRELTLVVTPGAGGLAVATARTALDRLTRAVPEEDRAHVVNRILRRVILERIRVSLHSLMANNAQLVDVGVESAQDIAEALGSYSRWQLTPTGPLGRLVFAFTEYFDDTGADPAQLMTTAFGGDPHSYVVGLGDTTALAHAGVRRIVLGLSATSYFPGAPHHHVHTKPSWWVADDTPGMVHILPAPILDEETRPRRISGLEGSARDDSITRIAGSLWGTYLRAELERLRADDRDRARVLLATTSYLAARQVAEGLFSAGVEASRICLAVRPGEDEPGALTDMGNRRWRELPADRLEDFPQLKEADILIAPLARVQRGVNIIGKGDRSALGSVWLIVRPIPLIDEPPELLAHIQAKALAEHRGPSSDPLALLAERRRTAGTYLDEIVRRPPYFQAQPDEVKLGVVAEIINGAIQLIGRARRGGTPAVLHLVDGAFHDRHGGTDFATLILQLREKWRRDGVLHDMRAYYGTTLEAFLTYAEDQSPGASSC
ncbi:hypothetical protein ACFWIA_02185 [Streptomyces sp. NPDC127068]|uniref:hypothetical protein n=1 Tax=Streptomyces sp. NPDC127068 TaxID=3347127 RepID=UPI003665E8EA